MEGGAVSLNISSTKCVVHAQKLMQKDGGWFTGEEEALPLKEWAYRKTVVGYVVIDLEWWKDFQLVDCVFSLAEFPKLTELNSGVDIVAKWIHHGLKYYLDL